MTNSVNMSSISGEVKVEISCELTLKAPRKMHLKMSSAEVVCSKKWPNITDELSIEVNSMNPEQTAPIGAV